METGSDEGTYIRKYGIVSEKATTGLLRRIGQFFSSKRKRKQERIQKRKMSISHQITEY